MNRNQMNWNCALLLSCVMAFLIGCGGGSKYNVPTASPEQKRPTRVFVPSFDDDREFVREAAKIGAATPLTWSRKYLFTRPDEAFGSAVEPFPQLLAKLVAEDLEKNSYFEQVFFAADDEIPDPGTYDVILNGNLKQSSSSGRGYTYFLVFPLGLSIYDFAWTLGLPKYSRKYDIEVEYQWLNGYTYEPISDPINIEYRTSSKFFTQYVNETKMEDLRKKFKQSTRELVEALPEQLPSAKDSYWADMRLEGQKYLAELERQQMLIERGTPPTFTLLDPVENAQIRGSITDIQWSVTSPNGLRNFTLTLNGSTISVPVNNVAMSNEATAPRSIPAQLSQVRLKMGENVILAKCEDWRDNTTQESITVYRLPQELTPVQRHALLISADTGAAEKSLTDLSKALTDPYIGQFENSNVEQVKNPSSYDALRNELNQFGAQIISGQLALIVVTGKADAATNSIILGSEKVSINDFLVMCRESIATDEAVILFDLDWNSETSDRVLTDLPQIPIRWAVATSAQTHAPNISTNGRTLYVDTLIKTLSDTSRDENVLTLERAFDIVAVDVKIESNDQLKPRIEGRYDPNMTLAAYE